MKKIISRGALFSLIVAVLSLLIFISGCGGSGIQGLENSGSTIDGSSVSKSLYSADKDKSSKECLYSKVTYTLDNGKIITYQFDPDTLSAVTPSKSGTQETRSSGVTRQAYDGTVMGLGDSMAAYVTDKLVATTNAYTFFPGAGIAEEYIVCPEPSVYPESNVPRQGVTVVPSPESGLGPITYTPTAPSFTGAVHIVANYILPDDPPKPWHESWDYVYLVGNPVPVLTQYYSDNGNVMGLQFTMGMGSDTENVVLPRTLGGWHFISNNNMSHSDDTVNMRELSIKDPVTFVADDNISNKIKVQAEIEELPTGSWTANIARAKDVIVDPDTQETTTIDLIWDPIEKYLAGDWIYNSGVITAALSKGLSLTAREIANLYMHTITAYEDTVKTFAMKSVDQGVNLTIHLNPNTIEPVNCYYDQTYQIATVEIQALNSQGLPLANFPIKITAVPDPNSGGHHHYLTSTQIPDGEFLNPTAGTGSYDSSTKQFIGATNTYGNLYVPYIPPHRVFDNIRINGISGTVKIKAFARNVNLSASDTLNVKVDGLVELPNYPDLYELVGGIETGHPEHPKNHYCSVFIVTPLRLIAQKYAKFNPGSKIWYNDISLCWGGVFDIDQDWNPAPNSHHIEHRLGENVDMTICDDRMERTILKYFEQVHPEGDHWHLRYKKWDAKYPFNY